MLESSFGRVAICCCLMSLGCQGGDCEAGARGVESFVDDEKNQVCETDRDCVVAYIGCADVAGAYCGQVGMSEEAAGSERWADLEDELSGCSSSCATCRAALVLSCRDGICSRGL